MVRDVDVPFPLRIFIFWLMTALPVSAQDVVPKASAQGDSAIEEVKGFEQFPGPAPEIDTNFLVGPAADADEVEIKAHITYSRVVFVFVISKLYETHALQFSGTSKCPLRFAEVDPISLQLRIGLWGGPSVSATYCAHILFDILQSAVIDRSTFSYLINVALEDLRRRDTFDSRWPRLAAESAAKEAFRDIYPLGSKGRLFLESPADYKSAEFDGFSVWFATQQNALRHLVTAPPPERAIASAPKVPGSSGPSGDDGCAPISDVRVQELKIDHHGWGHRSVIMIRNVYADKPGWNYRIENAALAALCDQDRTSSGGDGPIQCLHLIVGRDRWLILSAADRRNGADIGRYAQALARTLAEDKCVDPSLQVLVVDFLQLR